MSKPNPKPAAFAERAPYEVEPSSSEGELGFASRHATPADLSAPSFSESTRTTYDGGRGQAIDPTRDSTKTS